MNLRLLDFGWYVEKKNSDKQHVTIAEVVITSLYCISFMSHFCTELLHNSDILKVVLEIG